MSYNDIRCNKYGARNVRELDDPKYRRCRCARSGGRSDGGRARGLRGRRVAAIGAAQRWRASRAFFLAGMNLRPSTGEHAERGFRGQKAIFGERVWRLQSFSLFTEADKSRSVSEPTL